MSSNDNNTNICHDEFSTSLNVVKIFISVILLMGGMILKTDFNIFLFAGSYLIAGHDVVTSAIHNFIKGKVFDENLLMTISTLGAFFINEYAEACAVMILYEIGEFFQNKAVRNSKNSITSLLDMQPDLANLELNGEIIQKPSKLIKKGDIIIIRAGEHVPLDGIITEGCASFNTSAITGENIPKTFKAGDIIYGGYINLNNTVIVRVINEYEESAVSKILKLVRKASEKKSKSENFIKKFAKYYTPAVVAAAIPLALIPIILFDASADIWIKRALTFLVISCPCALVISVPLSFFAGLGGASRLGILIKGSEFIEKLSKPNIIIFDKTGTLTKGVFKVTQVISEPPFKEEDILSWAASAEYYSTHPIAEALKQNITHQGIKDTKEFAGMGVKANCGGKTVLVGNDKLMKKCNVLYRPYISAGAILYVSVDGVFAGTIVISDEIKPDTRFTVEQLKKSAKKIVMLTGDVETAAAETANEAGIEEYYSGLLPEDKVRIAEDYLKYGNVIFIGDGINDAPVLRRADAGIAMGALGSDAAIDAADVVITDDKISKVPAAVKISKKTMKIVYQNIIFSVGTKLIFLSLGALGLITMWGAVFADVGVTLCAVLNSMRALQIKDFIKK